MASVLIAVQHVLAEGGEPLHYKEITRRVLAGGLWQTDGKTPEATVNAQLTVHIKKHGMNATFRRVGAGVFALNGSAPVPASVARPSTNATSKKTSDSAGWVSFTDAAEQVLTKLGGG